MTTDSVRAYADLRRRTHNRPIACLWLATCILIAIALACIALAAIVTPTGAAAPSCATPALTFATLTTCKTQTASALLASPTATRTPQPSPTRIVATATVAPSPTPRSVWVCSWDYSHCSQFVGDYHVVGQIPTRTASPAPTVQGGGNFHADELNP